MSKISDYSSHIQDTSVNSSNIFNHVIDFIQSDVSKPRRRQGSCRNVI